MNLRLIGAGLALLLAFTAGWMVNGWRWEARQGAALQAEVDARAKAEQDAARKDTANEEKIAQLRAEIRNNTRGAYARANDPDRSCPVPLGVLREHNEAASVSDAPGEPDAALPATGEAEGARDPR